jgi:restriction system protein
MGLHMARRNRPILEDIATLPWWAITILAFIVYISMKYWLPTIEFSNPIFKGMAKASPQGASYAAGLFLFLAAMSAYNSWRKGELFDRQIGIETIRSISWQEFEELVGEAYRRKGYRVEESGGGGADGGVDLVLKKNGETLLVQCKHWRQYKIGVKVIRELYGVVTAENATGGIVISSGAFTQETIDFTKGKPLELIGGIELVKMVGDLKKAHTPVSHQPKANQCPLCGSEMVLRTAKKGPNAGEKFWGCSTYPKCRGTKTL